MSKRDYYEVLGIERSADEAAIKSAFRKLAMKYHPDKNPGDQEAEASFKEINEAYEVLSNPEKRKLYDQFGHAGVNQNGGPGAGGFGGFESFEGFGGFEDIFGSFFGGGGGFGGGFSSRQRSYARRGGDVQVELTLNFMEAVKGVGKKISFYRLDECPTCHGSGAEKDSDMKTCDTCHGSGEVRYAQRSLFGETISVQECPTCKGKGQIPDKACHTCKGKMKVRKKKTMDITIPAGVDNGNVMTLSGEGDIGERGGPRGDVLVHIRVRGDSTFQRDGVDIHQNLHISFPQAALGDEVTVDTLDGKIKLKIPAGTQSGTIKKITGGGIEHLRGYGKGDHYINIQVDVPEKLSDRQREALINFAKEMGEENAKDNRSFFDKVKDAIS